MTVPAVAQAVDATNPVLRAPFDGTITAVLYAPAAAITGADTNTRKIELVNKGAAGAGTAIAASIQFDSGVNAAASDEKALTLSVTPANLAVVAGDMLARVSTHLATGLADPGGLFIIEFERA